jgi:serine protease Do
MIRSVRGPAALVLLFLAQPAFAQTKDERRPAIARLFTDAVAKVSDSVVRVRAGGMDIAYGTAVDPAGYILTKGDELFSRGKLRSTLTVQLRDGTIYPADVIGYHRDTDLAMLKVDADLTPVTFADSKAAAVGNWVAVPGTGSDPVAAGVISVGARKLFGQEAWIGGGDRGFLGIITDKPKEGEGVLVRRIMPRSAAATGKLKEEDVILKVGDRTINVPADLQLAMESYKPGDTVVLSVRRGENELELKLKLGNKSELDRGEFQNHMGSDLSNRRTGFPSVIQHDTVLKASECGGPVVDLDGKVLGINIARAGRVETWALPGEVIRPLIVQFKEKKFSLKAEFTSETKSEKK